MVQKHVVSMGWFKQDSKWEPKLGYRVWPSDQELVFEPLQGTLSFRIIDGRFCVGYRHRSQKEIAHASGSNESLRYKFQPCPETIKTRGAQCKKCRGIDGIGRFELRPDLLPRAIVNREHRVYLAAFSSRVIKVGIASAQTIENRIVEQGPLAAAIVAKSPDGISVRLLEKQIGKALKISDRIPASLKEKLLLNGLDFDGARKLLKSTLKRLEALDDFRTNLEDNSQVLDMSEINDLKNVEERRLLRAKLGKGDVLFGHIAGNIGSFSIIQSDVGYYLLNAKRLAGWVVETEPESLVRRHRLGFSN